MSVEVNEANPLLSRYDGPSPVMQVGLDMIKRGDLAPQKLIYEEINLEASIDALANFDQINRAGISVITDFN